MMASKRKFYQDQEGEDRDRPVPGQETKRRDGDSEQADSSAVSGQWMNDILEPLLRTVMREEIPIILQRLLSPCCSCRATLTQNETSRGRALQLRFMNKLSPTIFTFSKIVAEDGAPLGIALCDAGSQNCIVNEGPLSSIKVEICVLNGDFGSHGCEDWTAEDFKANMTRQRENKGPLLNGNRFITLEQGVGFISRIVFTDNSRWTRSRMFCLGARIVEPTSIHEADIREGKSEPFVVKDNRGESYKKHEQPSLNDEIWRLRKIAKDGKIHKQLSSSGIITVQDLLRLHITNPTLLKEMFGCIPRKSWDIVIEHAKACVIDNAKRYIYYTGEQPKGLLFNCIYEVVEVTFDGREYRPLECLNLEEKRLVERVKQKAYKILKDFIPVDKTSIHCLVEPLPGLKGQCSIPAPALRQVDFSTAQQFQAEMEPSICQPSTSTSNISEAVSKAPLDIDQLPEWGEMVANISAAGEFMSDVYFDGNIWNQGGWHGQLANFLSPSIPIPCGQGNTFYSPYGDGTELNCHSRFHNSAVSEDISRKGKRKTFWYKIRTALKWIMPYAAKRSAKLHPYN